MRRAEALLFCMLLPFLVGASQPIECPPKLPAPPVCPPGGCDVRVYQGQVEIWKTQVWALIESCKIAQRKSCEEICKGEQGAQTGPSQFGHK